MSSSLNFSPYAPPPDAAPRPSLSNWSTPSYSTPPLASASDPPPAAPSSSSFPSSSSSYQSGAPVSSLSNGTSYSSSSASPYSAPYGSSAAGGYANLAGTGALTSGYETTTLRHDYAGPLCYVFGPLGAAVMLVFEIENDWVRYQAWQSVMVNGVLVFLHLFFLLLFGQGFFQYLLVLLDISVLTLLSLRAFRDSDHLERYKVPIVGELADQFVRAE